MFLRLREPSLRIPRWQYDEVEIHLRYRLKLYDTHVIFLHSQPSESYLLKNLSLKINNNKKQTQEQNTTHSFTIFKGKWNITHTDSWATLGASPHWPSKLKSGKSSSRSLWWKTLIGLLPRICTILMIPFEEYVFDISFSLFRLPQLKTSWWL